MNPPVHREEFVARLRDEGRRRYHDKHPFNVRMHEGLLTRVELSRWVLNRYYYQTRIPIKDALIVAKMERPEWRRSWLRRIVDHDGAGPDDGGLSAWLQLASGVGLEVEEVRCCDRVLPAVRFACDAYVALVREQSLVEAIASSLTEYFAPDIMARRIAAWQTHYPWVRVDALDYFRRRIALARRDSEEAIEYVVELATSRETQDLCVLALVRKTQILWAILDAVERATEEER